MQSKPRYFLLFLLVIPLMTLATQAIAAEPEPAAIIPRPAKVHWLKGQVQLDSGTRIIYANEAAKGEAEMLASLLRPATGLPLPVQPMPTLAATLDNAIKLNVDRRLRIGIGQGRLSTRCVSDVRSFKSPPRRRPGSSTAGKRCGNSCRRPFTASPNRPA